MELHYTAWLRNRAGKAKETVEPPATVSTLEDLVGWLCASGGQYEALFSYRSIINASVNGALAGEWGRQPVKAGDKISFFSPMAGG